MRLQVLYTLERSDNTNVQKPEWLARNRIWPRGGGPDDVIVGTAWHDLHDRATQ